MCCLEEQYKQATFPLIWSSTNFFIYIRRVCLIFHSVSTPWINILTDNHTSYRTSYHSGGGFNQQGIGYNCTLHKTRRFLHREVLWGKSSLQSSETSSDHRIHNGALEHRKLRTEGLSEWDNKTGSPWWSRGTGGLLSDFMLTISS